MTKAELEKAIKKCFASNNYLITRHARIRMVERSVALEDIEAAVENGKISVIEESSVGSSKVKWIGKDLDGDKIKVIIVYELDSKSIVITIFGD